MSTLDVVQDWMMHIGPMLDLQRVTQFEDEARWVLSTEHGVQFECVLDEATGRLVIGADVAPLPVEARSQRVEALLAWNAAWTEHGGMRAALDVPSALVRLLLDVPTAGMNLNALCAVLSRFADVAMAWRDVLASAPPPAADAGGSITHLIRV